MSDKHAQTTVVAFPAPVSSRQTLSVIDPNRSPASDPPTSQADADQREDDSYTGFRPLLHIEARLKAHSNIRIDALKQLLVSYIHSNYISLEPDSVLQEDDWREVEVLDASLDRIRVAECSNCQEGIVYLDDVTLEVHVYQTAAEDFGQEFAMTSAEEEDANDTTTSAASITDLPNALLDGLWHNLIYETGMKERLLQYVTSTLLFSDAGVDFDVISCNRVVLLHGPPGTGKTSLCRALAQKLAIRFSSRYRQGKLVEINSHSLFSKWFSESGKLVQRLFSSVLELVDDEDNFVVVMIDEVESLTSARASALGTEPSDAVRVVNALLTQIDKLKQRQNVLVVTTSNLSHAIDSAFVDRADIKQFIGLPPPQAVYWILSSCLTELMKRGMIRPVELLDWKAAMVNEASGSTTPAKATISKDASSSPSRKKRKTSNTATTPHGASMTLYALAKRCKEQGMSGRALRRLTVLAHARYIGTSGAKDIDVWLEAMKRVCSEESEQMKQVRSGNN